MFASLKGWFNGEGWESKKKIRARLACAESKLTASYLVARDLRGEIAQMNVRIANTEQSYDYLRSRYAAKIEECEKLASLAQNAESLQRTLDQKYVEITGLQIDKAEIENVGAVAVYVGRLAEKDKKIARMKAVFAANNRDWDALNEKVWQLEESQKKAVEYAALLVEEVALLEDELATDDAVHRSPDKAAAVLAEQYEKSGVPASMWHVPSENEWNYDVEIYLTGHGDLQKKIKKLITKYAQTDRLKVSGE